MDVKALKVAIANMLGQQLALDESGNPTAALIRANPQAPMSLATTDLPTWVILARNATYPTPPDQSEHRLASETRDFDFVLFVAQSQSGTDGEAELKVEPYVDYCRNWIQSHIQLYVNADQVPGIMRSYLVRDTGIFTRRYTSGPELYVGIAFTVRVEGRNIVTYGAE